MCVKTTRFRKHVSSEFFALSIELLTKILVPFDTYLSTQLKTIFFVKACIRILIRIKLINVGITGFSVTVPFTTLNTVPLFFSKTKKSPGAKKAICVG